MSNERQFADALQDMKRAILLAAEEAVTKFQAETGITPEEIVIETVDVSTAGRGRDRALSSVRVELGDW